MHTVVGGGLQNVLVVGADALSKYVDWTDRGICILFGDAAGAVLVQVKLIFCVNIYISPHPSKLVNVPWLNLNEVWLELCSVKNMRSHAG